MIDHQVHVIIHEATFHEEKQEDAVKKRHSTSQEAISTTSQVFDSYSASDDRNLLILTHFSQRYPIMPPSFINNNKFSIIPANDQLMIHLSNCNYQELSESISRMMTEYLKTREVNEKVLDDEN